jgi:MoxR-like ATPase
MTDTTPTPGRVWRRMTAEQRQRAARAFWRDETGAAERAQAVQLIAQHMKSRPKTVAALDDERRARYLASVPTLSDAMAARVLMLYHLAEQRPMMGAFLDALGIAHDDGVIRNDDAVPDAGKVAAAAAAIADAYPAADVSIYLNTLLSQDPGTWGTLGGVPQLEVENRSGGRT